MSKKKLSVYDYENRPKAWEKAGFRWNGMKWSQHCLCHDKPWKEHDKILNAEKKEWAV